MTTKRLKLHLEQLLWEYMKDGSPLTRPFIIDINYRDVGGVKSGGSIRLSSPKKTQEICLKDRKYRK